MSIDEMAFAFFQPFIIGTISLVLLSVVLYSVFKLLGAFIGWLQGDV